MENQNIQAVADEIISYIRKHPNAVDSVEGIASWWITRERYSTAINIVQDALNMLESSGRLLKSTTGNGKEIYSLNVEKND